MLKKTLHLTISLTITTIVLLIVVIIMQLSVKSMIEPDNGTFNTSMTVTQITYHKNGMVLLTGNDGSNGFYKLYSSNSKLIDEGTFKYLDTNIVIHEVSSNDNGFNLICKATNRNGSYGLAYTYDITEKKLDRKELPILPGNEDYNFYVSGSRYYAAGQQYVYELNLSDKSYKEIKMSNVYKVHDVCYNDGNIYIAGQRASNSTLTEGTYAFYSAYSNDGELLWEYNAMDEYKSAIIKLLTAKDGSIVMLGKYSENKSYVISKIITPNIPNIKEEKLSSFIIYADKNGNIKASDIYKSEDKIYVSDLTGISEYNRIMSAGFFTSDLSKNKYTCNINLINKELAHMQGFKFTSQIDTLYYITGNEDIGIYVCIHINGTNNYKLKHYAEITDFITEMKLFNALKSSLTYITSHVHSIIFMYISIATYVLLKIKYSRRIPNEKAA